jgi:PhnB protein
MLIQPYLFFEGRCEEAIEFYRRVLGAEITMLMRFRDSPEPAQCDQLPAGSEDKIMHASIKIGETAMMISDGMCNRQSAFNGFSLALTAQNENEADRLFAALADGGTVQMPLEKTFWSPRFGMVTDRFGVSWMVNTLAE